MKNKIKLSKALLLTTACVMAAGVAPAQSNDAAELEQLKAAMKEMQKNMDQMQQKIDKLEQEKAAAETVVGQSNTVLEAASPSVKTLEKAANGQDIGTASPVQDRESLNDQQQAASRPNDTTLDPKYRGFWPIPNTPMIIQFNAKPRVDMTADNKNSGNPDRFVTATIPVEGSAGYGGNAQFNVNARGSSLSVDVRAPDLPGNLRFYYNNDFFGSGSGMSYRLKQLYGEFYNVTAGWTYSVFEDPDAWPDTVDFEGPNAVIFARRPVVHYQWQICDQLEMTLGVEQPSAEIDANSTPNTFTTVNTMPDAGFNLRWENAKVGHVQGALILRDIGAHGPGVGSQSVFGWGVNLATSLNAWGRDSFQGQATYGEGIFRYFNDDFINNDAAFDASGNLNPLKAFGITGGYTHYWTDTLRSTATYGFVDIDNDITQGPMAYHRTHYGSLNLVWQIRKHLSVGVEGLYGFKSVQGGASGDVWRLQMGLVYSLF
jgi:hypothetical protein